MMKNLGRIGERKILLGDVLPSPVWIGDVPSSPWIALVFCNSQRPRAELHGFAKRCLVSGARYVCCAGANARVLEDAFDREIVEGGFEQLKEIEVIPTTSDQSLTEALWFAINCAIHPSLPTESVVCFSLGPLGIEDEISDRLKRFKQGWVPDD